MWKEKLGGYLIDVSKYVLTGIVIASMFKDMGESRLLLYGIGLLIACTSLASGLLLNGKKEKNDGFNYYFVYHSITLRNILVVVPYPVG